MIDEDLYWKIVQESLEETNDQDEQEAFLISRLRFLQPANIIGFPNLAKVSQANVLVSRNRSAGVGIKQLSILHQTI